MKKTSNIWYKFCSIASFCTIVSTNVVVLAQVTPDNTLPNNSDVKVEGNKSTIEGGTQAGGNLFHSFEKFGVPTGGEAHFNNAADIQNIISRVTGKSISDIDGLIKANGSANLFLINPNGIVFGENARLDIGGSFVGSTADSFKFGDGKEFSATQPQQAPLLTMNVPVGLQYGANPVKIQVQGDGQGLREESDLIIDTQDALRVQPDKTLALVGGDINLEGATLKTAGGRIELGSVKREGLVNLTSTEKGFSLGYDAVENGGNIELSQQAAVDASGNGGGDIQVWGKNIKLRDGSEIEASTLGSENGGNLVVKAQESVEVISASNSQFPNGLFASVYSQAKGKGGNLTIKTNTLLVQDGAQVSAVTLGKGKGGNLTVEAQDVQLIDETNNDEFGSGLYAQARSDSTGDAGDLKINTNTLLVQDGAQVSAGTFGRGKGGNLTVEAQDVQLIGTSNNGEFGSGLYAQVQPDSTGDAGDLKINTNTLLVQDGAQVSAGTFGRGKGGNLTVEAQDVQLIGRSNNGEFGSGLFTQAQPDSTGDAGDLKINTDILQVEKGARVSVRGLGTGRAGNLIIDADSIRLNNDALLSANTRSNKIDPETEQATININSQDLIMRRGSNIRSNATGENVIGGNINIETDFLIANENSDISANSENFRGGNVRIDAQGIFGTQFRLQSTLQSDITATGVNEDSSGIVEIITPETDPTSGSIESPTIPVETEIVDACSTPGYAQSSFTITGTGSLVQSPFEPLPGRLNRTRLATLEGDGEMKPQRRRRRQTRKEEAQIKQIVEARGWVRTKDGRIILVAQAPQKTNFQPRTNSGNCKFRGVGINIP